MEELTLKHSKGDTRQKPAHSGHAIALPWLTFFRGVKMKEASFKTELRSPEGALSCTYHS